MVEERDFKEFPDVEQPLGYVPIGLRRGRAAAGVVVREDDRRGPALEGQLDDRAWIYDALVDRALRNDFGIQHAVAVVKKQRGDVFLTHEPEMEFEVLLDVLPVRDEGLLTIFFLEAAGHQFLDKRKKCGGLRANAFDGP